jgi:hypothetical protein
MLSAFTNPLQLEVKQEHLDEAEHLQLGKQPYG